MFAIIPAVRLQLAVVAFSVCLAATAMAADTEKWTLTPGQQERVTALVDKFESSVRRHLDMLDHGLLIVLGQPAPASKQKHKAERSPEGEVVCPRTDSLRIETQQSRFRDAHVRLPFGFGYLNFSIATGKGSVEGPISKRKQRRIGRIHKPSAFPAAECRRATYQATDSKTMTFDITPLHKQRDRITNKMNELDRL